MEAELAKVGAQPRESPVQADEPHESHTEALCMSDALPPIDHEHTAMLVMDYQPGVLQRLDEQLRDRGVDTLLLAGISTSGVVLSTVRDAQIATTGCSSLPTCAPISIRRCTHCCSSASFPARPT